jgi:hypothetical protein
MLFATDLALGEEWIARGYVAFRGITNNPSERDFLLSRDVFQ